MSSIWQYSPTQTIRFPSARSSCAIYFFPAMSGSCVPSWRQTKPFVTSTLVCLDSQPASALLFVRRKKGKNGVKGRKAKHSVEHFWPQ